MEQEGQQVSPTVESVTLEEYAAVIQQVGKKLANHLRLTLDGIGAVQARLNDMVSQFANTANVWLKTPAGRRFAEEFLGREQRTIARRQRRAAMFRQRFRAATAVRVENYGISVYGSMLAICRPHGTRLMLWSLYNGVGDALWLLDEAAYIQRSALLRGAIVPMPMLLDALTADVRLPVLLNSENGANEENEIG